MRPMRPRRLGQPIHRAGAVLRAHLALDQAAVEPPLAVPGLAACTSAVPVLAACTIRPTEERAHAAVARRSDRDRLALDEANQAWSSLAGRPVPPALPQADRTAPPS
jgi:hypothetical protein